MNGELAERTLLVPMSLDALVVSEEQKVANMAPNFAPNRFRRFVKIGSSFRPKPWNREEDITLQAGVHLHWALPAALRNGKQTKSGEIQFPLAPNRWLVLRIPNDPKQTKAWLLQSDYISDPSVKNPDEKRDSGQENSRYILLPEADSYVVRQIGRAFAYEVPGWEEELSADRRWPITAVAPGNPGFAAFYPGCPNVFGFYDKLDGIKLDATEQIRFSYLVAGWYESPANDPLSPAKEGDEDAVKWADHFRKSWLEPLEREKSKESDWATYVTPNRTLCHGTLHGIIWPKRPEPPLADQYSVAVANTATEALSAFVSQRISRPQFESLLSAFQYDMLGSMDKLHGMLELDQEIHWRAFQPVEGNGTRWVLRPLERSVAAKPGEKQQRPASFPNDANIARLFDELCDKQVNCDQLARHRIALGEQYFALWYQRKRLAESNKAEESNALADADTKLQGSIQTTDASLQYVRKDIEGLCEQIKQAILAVAKAAHKERPSPQPDYELVAVPMPAFWRPNDPSILVASPGPTRRHRYATSSDKPMCRLGKNLVSKLTSSKTSIDLETVKSDVVFPIQKRPKSKMPYAMVAELYYESLLLDSERTSHFVNLVCDKRNMLLADRPDVAEFNNDISKKLQALDGIAEYEAGWDPLFIVWKLEWSSSYSDPSGWNAEGKWKLGGSSDYEYLPKGVPAPTEKGSCYGWAPLSISLGEQLKERVPTDIYEHWNFLTQSTNGLTNMLLLREECLQLPPLDKEGRLLTAVQGLAGFEPKWSPLIRAQQDPPPPKFSPVRAGHFRLLKLLLVDVFGRFKILIDESNEAQPKPIPVRLPDAKIYVSESFGGGTRDLQSWITPPPRITQPTRLKCSWVSAAKERDGKGYKESNSDPATSPILGWVVPNYFDRSLVICDRKGKVRGEIRVLAGAAPRVGLSAVPGHMPYGEGKPLGDADCFQLQDFVDGICAGGSSALQACLTLMGRLSMCVSRPAAQQMQTMGLVLGQPLALARASVSLQVWGKLAGNPPWGEPSHPRISFPVRLGDVRKSDDGLIGYFVSDIPGEKTYSRMLLPYSAPLPRECPRYLKPGTSAEVCLEEGPLKLTLLMDPRAGVHIVSEILPSQFLELPESAIAEALENIELSFRVGPVLAVDGALRLPLPADVSGSWRWFNRDLERGTGWYMQPDVAKAPSGSAIPSQRVEVYDGWLSHNKRD